MRGSPDEPVSSIRRASLFVCSRPPLGWFITGHLREASCLDALLAAVATRGGRRYLADGIMFHSGHGTR